MSDSAGVIASWSSDIWRVSDNQTTANSQFVWRTEPTSLRGLVELWLEGGDVYKAIRSNTQQCEECEATQQCEATYSNANARKHKAIHGIQSFDANAKETLR